MEVMIKRPKTAIIDAKSGETWSMPEMASGLTWVPDSLATE